MASIDLFDPLNSGLQRDKSIVSYEYKSFEPVGGRDLTNNRNNTIKIVTKGTNQHLLPSEGYLDIVFRASSAHGFVIQAGVNDQFGVRAVAGNYTLATVNPGVYATIADLNTAFQAAITDTGVGVATEFELDVAAGPVPPANTVTLEITTTATNAISSEVIAGQSSNTFFRYLGFADGQRLGIGVYPAVNAFVDQTIMHDSVLSAFRKCSLWLNNVQIHSIDYPVFSSSIVKWLEYSNNYITQQGPKEWFFTDSDASPSAARKNPLLQNGATKDVCRRAQIKLSSIFPFLKTYDKVLRGCTLTIELEKNNNVREVVYNSNGNTSAFSIKEATLWCPELIGSDEVEGSLLDDIISKKRTVISYENHEVYRQLNPPQSNVTYVLDSLSEVPIFVYVALQQRSRLESDDLAAFNSADRNPSVYDNLKLVRAECKVNGRSYPKMPYQVSFEDPSRTSSDEFVRLFLEFYRTMMKEDELDNGSALEYTSQFKNKYPIITFNLEREEEIQSNKAENNTIEVNLQFSTVPTQYFYINALVVYQNHIVLSTDGKKYEWSRQ